MNAPYDQLVFSSCFAKIEYAQKDMAEERKYCFN